MHTADSRIPLNQVGLTQYARCFGLHHNETQYKDGADTLSQPGKVIRTGMRMGETLALRRKDFNSSACEISVNHTLYRGKLKQPKTETSKRTIKLDPSIVTLIDSHLTASVFKGPDDYIFCRDDGRSENSSALRAHLYKAMDRIGIKRVARLSGFHCLRLARALWFTCFRAT